MDVPHRPVTTSHPKSLVGSVIAGRYEVIKELGAGGMGVVLRARQIAMNREVALKVLHPQFSQNRQAVARFHREMQVTSRLEHAHTIRVYDFGETEDGQLYLAMELVPGKTLSELLGAQAISSTKPMSDGEGESIIREGLPLPRLVHIARQIALALKAAHGEGIVHRDLKPDNVMLIDRYGDKDTVKVLDFGIARFADEDVESQRLTAEGAVVGTPAYMSPEQATGRPVGAATDIYAFGVMLFEMATGTIPFSAPTTVSLMVMHVQEPPPRPSTVAPVDPRLEALILSCLAKDPADRPASAEAIIAALDALIAPGPGQRPPTGGSNRPGGDSPGGPPRPAKRGSKLPLLLALFALVAVGVTLALVLGGGGNGSGGAGPVAVADTVSEPSDAAAAPDASVASADAEPASDASTGTAETLAAAAVDAATGDATPDTAASHDSVADGAADGTAADGAAADGAAPTDGTAPADSGSGADGVAGQALASARAALDKHYEDTKEPPPPEPCRASEPGLVATLTEAKLLLEPAPEGAEPTEGKAFDKLRVFSEANADPFANSAEAQAFFARATLKAVSTPAEALAPAQRATELCPEWAFSHNVLGNVHQAMTNLDEARRAYTRATTLAPTWGVPRFNLALVELSAKQPVAAIAVLDRLITDHPSWDHAHLIRAQARLASGDKASFPLAEADALRATELTPDNAKAFFLLGESRRAQKLAEAAREAYCKAKALGFEAAARYCP